MVRFHSWSSVARVKVGPLEIARQKVASYCSMGSIFQILGSPLSETKATLKDRLFLAVQADRNTKSTQEMTSVMLEMGNATKKANEEAVSTKIINSSDLGFPSWNVCVC